jgi:hypothetical protein
MGQKKPTPKPSPGLHEAVALIEIAQREASVVSLRSTTLRTVPRPRRAA